MMNSARSWAAVLLIVFLGASSSTAFVIACSLEEMIKESDLVLMGEVTDIIKTEEFAVLPAPGGDKRIHYFGAVINPLKMYKGIGRESPVHVRFLRGLSVEPDFAIGEVSVLFLESYNGRLQTTRGNLGKVPLVSGDALGIIMTGEESRQKASEFIAKIVRIAQ